MGGEMAQVGGTSPQASGTSRRWAVDAGIAVLVAALQLAGTYGAAQHHGQRAGPLAAVVVCLAGLVLVARRRFPLGVLVVTGALSIGYWAASSLPSPIFLADVVAFVTVVLARQRLAAVLALLAYYAGYQWLPALTGTQHVPSALGALLAAAGLVVLLGA